MRELKGKALHKPDVGVAKSAKHKLLKPKECNKLRERKKEYCTNPMFVRQGTQNKNY